MIVKEALNLPLEMQNSKSKETAIKSRLDKNEEKLGETHDTGKVDLDSFQHLLKGVNEKMEPYDTQIEFSIHEKSKQVMIKIVNMNTKETIREIPSEKLTDIIANLLEVSGILVDEKA
jgi:flagellar protein FlaG